LIPQIVSDQKKQLFTVIQNTKTCCLRVGVTTIRPVSHTMSKTTDDFNKQFSVETQWMIKDLTSETGKKFNGKTCVVVSTFDVASGRVGVRIKNERNRGRILNIKPINLYADHSTTETEGLKETRKQEAEDKEDCPICCGALPKISSKLTRLTCCGKGMHRKCAEDLRKQVYAIRTKCPMCRAKVVKTGSKGDIERLSEWVKKGKAWAMVMF
jgi:hypothetical protein